MIVDENLNDCSNKLIRAYNTQRKLKNTACILAVLLAISCYSLANKLENTFKENENLVITLQQDEQLIQHNYRQDTIDAMIVAFAVQESNTTENAVSDCDKYVGCIQMSKIMVDEANRILGYDNFTHDDRFVWDSCARMFEIVQTYHNPTLDIDKAITIWNKGCPNSYRNNVKKVYKGVLRHLTNKQ